MVQRVLEFETAAADELLGRREGQFIPGTNGITRFAGDLAVDSDLACQNGTLGFFAASKIEGRSILPYIASQCRALYWLDDGISKLRRIRADMKWRMKPKASG